MHVLRGNESKVSLVGVTISKREKHTLRRQWAGS